MVEVKIVNTGKVEIYYCSNCKTNTIHDIISKTYNYGIFRVQCQKCKNKTLRF